MLKLTLAALLTSKIVLTFKSLLAPDCTIGLYVSGYLPIAIKSPSTSKSPTSLIVKPPTLPGIIVSATIQFGLSLSTLTEPTLHV